MGHPDGNGTYDGEIAVVGDEIWTWVINEWQLGPLGPPLREPAPDEP